MRHSLMGKPKKLYQLVNRQVVSIIGMAGFWIEMAEEIEVNDFAGRVGKNVLVLLKIVCLPK